MKRGRLTVKEMVHRYVHDGRSIESIAQEAGLQVGYVTELLRDAGVRFRPRRDAAPAESAPARTRDPAAVPARPVYATEAEAPVRCPHCGGPWRETETGRSCVVCARGIVIKARQDVALGKRPVAILEEDDRRVEVSLEDDGFRLVQWRGHVMQVVRVTYHQVRQLAALVATRVRSEG